MPSWDRSLSRSSGSTSTRTPLHCSADCLRTGASVSTGVRSGAERLRSASDHDEEFVAGDFYYAPPGHVPIVSAGTRVVEVTPTADLARTMEVLQANMAAE